MAKHWAIQDIPDQHGKIVVITGANSGIGFETALALAGKGAQVILAARSPEKGQAAVEKIRSRYAHSSPEPMLLDLADLSSLPAFAASFLSRFTSLDVLINNAGLMAIPLTRTADGFEMQFGTNHLGHFALTGLLLPALLKAEAGRVVTVSSISHHLGVINFKNLDGSISYGPWNAYHQSKLANLLFTYELQRMFEAHHAQAISVGCHPGYSATNLQVVGPRMSGSKPIENLMVWANRTFAQSAAMGSLPVLYAATAPEVAGGDFIGPLGLGGMSGYPGKVQSSHRSHHVPTAKRLWEISEDMTRVHYSIPV